MSNENTPNDDSHQPAVEGRVDRGVRPPAEISPDGREVWDWAVRLSERVHLNDELRRLRLQVHNTRTTCGSCTKWMTDSCPREQHDNRTGRKRGPSNTAIKCDRFAMSAVDAASVEKAEERIAALSQRLQAA